MVYAGTETVSLVNDGETPAIVINTAGIDADSEEGAAVDIYSQGNNWKQGLPNAITFKLTRTGGSTDAVSVDLQGSIDGVTYDTLLTITDVTGGASVHNFFPVIDYTSATEVKDKLYRYFKHVCTTVGAGNTLTATTQVGRV